MVPTCGRGTLAGAAVSNPVHSLEGDAMARTGHAGEAHEAVAGDETAPRALVIGVVGAESTGKTLLVKELARTLRERGLQVVAVPEALRLFCDREGRTPRVDEQQAIANEQTRRIAAATQRGAIVLADTTALMTAVYSEIIFGDCSLHAQALLDHARCDLTLLTALDLPWVPDGIIRDGPQVREAVDTCLRRLLQEGGVPHALVMGKGLRRQANALSCIEHLLGEPARRQRQAGASRWRWFCDNCDDGECEQHWLTRAVSSGGSDAA